MKFKSRDRSSHPPYILPPYKSSLTRGPKTEPIIVPQSLTELTGPAYDESIVGELDHDLTRNGQTNGEPIGERLIITGRILDENGDAAANTLVEIWQANAAGRYVHTNDQHDAPLDPNFLGAGRALTDDEGWYKFTTIRPGAYPWGNHYNAWRPTHIHFSLLGPNIMTRLITQMYFEGDPLIPFDPIFAGSPAGAKDRLVAKFSLELTEPGFALAYRFDIVLRGPEATPFEA
ncbi:MAG: protocatechuate 3,4-dioxygenase subunit beta [Verrucomicrobia bacterium]|nr:protocatechuate 3,4-dioxygenase subunit beta [Verrucomicrobiota bacterium]